MSPKEVKGQQHIHIFYLHHIRQRTLHIQSLSIQLGDLPPMLETLWRCQTHVVTWPSMFVKKREQMDGSE
jgi:hypothetical protein